MKKNALLFLPLALILSGCGEKPEEAATVPEAAEEAAAAAAPDQMECETRAIPPKCISIHANPKIMLNTNGMLAVPPNACVAAGTTVKFIIQSSVPAGTIEIRHKDPADTWLAGTNSPDPGVISITIPASVPNKTDHAYGWANLNTGECVDPMMRVDDQGPIETEGPGAAGIEIEDAMDKDMDKAELPDD